MSDTTLPNPAPAEADPHEVIDRALSAAREMTGMDLAFVGQFTGGSEVIRRTDGDAEPFGIVIDDGPDLGDTYCHRMADGRLSCLVPDTGADPVTRALPITDDANLGAYLGVPLTLPDGRLYGALCCISEDPAGHLEARHVELMHVLARLVGDQLAQLEATELARQAQEEIFAAFGHDVRTPLAPIRGYAELLRSEHGGDPFTEEATEAILRNAQRLEDMLEDVLLLVRHRANALVPRCGPVDLGALVEAATADATTAARGRDVTIGHEPAPGPAELIGDERLLRRVLDNLLSNAVKFSPEGGDVTVRVRDTGDELIVEVADEGIGIAEHDVARLFERFYRTPDARERGISGTGLGLSICRAVVTAHGGSIEVDSQPGRGSTFTVRLPFEPS
jgi:signal transduction histidine kinase